MLVLVPHLFPPPQLLDAAQDLRLPTLQTLLARGRRESCPAAGTEAALCEALGIEQQQDWPVAPITLEADGGTAGSAYCLRVDPVHLRVMRDRIVLAGDAPDLTPDEADTLASAIGTHFGDALCPLPLRPQRWYLRLPRPAALTTTPPSLAAGRDIQPLLPQGPDATHFRAQLNEVQMLLHDHPVNQAREARGALPVNALWPWGGGVLPAAHPHPWRIACQHEDLQALARFAGATVNSSIDASSDVAVFDALAAAIQAGDAFGWREALHQLEQTLAAVQTKHARVSLIDPVRGLACHGHRLDRWQVWRKRSALGTLLRADP